jgi:hypothetical protein
MGDSSNLGDLNLSIGGDIGPLQDAFDSIPAVAQQAVAGIDQALAGIGSDSSTATAGIQQLSDALSGMWSGDWAGEAQQFGAAVAGVGEAASGAVPPVHDLGDAAQHAGEGAKEAGSAFDELKGHITDLLKEFGLMIGVAEAVKESLAAFAQEQTFTVAMGAMTGSTETAVAMLEQLKATALEIPIALDSLLAATQKMEAFGIATERIPELLHAAADAAEATHNSFDLVAASLERISITGQVNARQLVQLGLSWEDLARTAGTSIAAVQELVKKGGQSIDEDLTLVVTALQQKFGGLAETMGSTLAGGFQIFKNQLTELAAQWGEVLAPAATGLMMAVQLLMQALSALAEILTVVEGAISKLGDFMETGAEAIRAFAESLGLSVGAFGGAAEAAALYAQHLEMVKQNQQALSDLVSRAAGVLSEYGIKLTQGNESLDTFQQRTIKAAYAMNDIGAAFTSAKDGQIVLTQSLTDFLVKIPGAIDVMAKWAEALRAVKSDAPDAAAQIAAIGKAAQEEVGALLAGATAHTNYAATLSTLEAKVKSTKVAMDEANQQYAETGKGAGIAETATKAYEAAVAAVDGSTQKATHSIDAFAGSFKSMGKEIQSSFDLASDSYDSYLERLDNGGKSAQDQLAKINEEIQKATALLDRAPANKKTIITQWIDDLTALKTDMQDFAQRDVVREQLTALSDSLVDLESKAATASEKIPADFADMMAGVTQGVNFGGMTTSFDKMIADLKTKFALLPAELQAADAGATQEMVDNLTAASDKLHSMDDAMKLIGSNKALTQLATEVKGLADQEDLGALSANQFQLGLNKVSDELLKNLVPAIEKGVEITPELITQLGRLGDTGKILAEAARIGPEAFIQAVQDMAEKTREAALTIGNAFKDLGATSLASVAQSMTRYGADITKALSDVQAASKLTASEFAVDQNAIIVWADKVLPLMKNFGVAISDDVLAQVAKLAPALAVAAKEGPDAFATALQKMKDTASTAIMGIADAYKEFGAQSLPVLDSILERQQKGYDLLVSSGAPLAAQLDALTKINTTQMSIAQATDATGQSELAVAQNLTQIQLAQFAIHQQTMGMADEWAADAKAVVTAWNSVSGALADAIVNGKSFGAAMDSIVKTLATSILTNLIKGVLNDMLASIITNTTAMHLLGITSTATQGTVAASMAASAASMAASSASMAASMAGSAAAVVASTATVDASLGGMAISGTAALTAMAAAMATSSAAVDASALAMVPIVGGALAAVAGSYVASVPLIGGALAAMSGATVAGTATAGTAMAGFAAVTTTSMGTAAAAVTAGAATMMVAFTAIAGIVGAIAGIFSAIETAHTNTLLTRIEESTRRLDITTEGAVVQGLAHLVTLEDIKNLLFSIEASDFNSEALLESISTALAGGGNTATTLNNAAANLAAAATATTVAAASTTAAAANTATAAASIVNSSGGVIVASADLTAAASSTTTAAASTTAAAADTSTAAASTTTAAGATTTAAAATSDAAKFVWTAASQLQVSNEALSNGLAAVGQIQVAGANANAALANGLAAVSQIQVAGANANEALANGLAAVSQIQQAVIKQVEIQAAPDYMHGVLDVLNNKLVPDVEAAEKTLQGILAALQDMLSGEAGYQQALSQQTQSSGGGSAGAPASTPSTGAPASAPQTNATTAVASTTPGGAQGPPAGNYSVSAPTNPGMAVPFASGVQAGAGVNVPFSWSGGTQEAFNAASQAAIAAEASAEAAKAASDAAIRYAADPAVIYAKAQADALAQSKALADAQTADALHQMDLRFQSFVDLSNKNEQVQNVMDAAAGNVQHLGDAASFATDAYNNLTAAGKDASDSYNTLIRDGLNVSFSQVSASIQANEDKITAATVASIAAYKAASDAALAYAQKLADVHAAIVQTGLAQDAADDQQKLRTLMNAFSVADKALSAPGGGTDANYTAYYAAQATLTSYQAAMQKAADDFTAAIKSDPNYRPSWEAPIPTGTGPMPIMGYPALPSYSGPGGPGTSYSPIPPVSSTNGGTTINVNLSAGVVAGSNGMSQLSQMVGAQVVQSLRLSGGAKL